MNAPRVLVVTRRFWPFTEDSCHRLLHQCEALKKAGADVTVLTSRWHPSWPEYAECREVPIHRLLPSPATNWNEGHFQKNVIHWINKSISQFDCIYVDRSDGLLAALQTKTNKWDLPVIARFAPEDSGFALSNSQRMAQTAMADSCRRCFRVVCSTPYSHRLLISQGIQESQIVRIADVGWERIVRSEETRVAAANALFETCSDFVVPGRTEILLHLGVAESKSLKTAVQSFCDFLDRGTLMRMWIVGCGAPINSVYDLIKSRGWHREILIFDGFDDLTELIQVADLAIVSNPNETLQYTLPTLALAGVPTFVADHPESRAWLPHVSHSFLYSSDSPVLDKLLAWQSHRETWMAAANSLRLESMRSHSTQQCVEQWLSLFRDTSVERRA